MRGDSASDITISQPADSQIGDVHGGNKSKIDPATRAWGRGTEDAEIKTVIDSITLRVRHLESNKFVTLNPALVLLADGKSALPDSPPTPTSDIGIKSHWTHVDGPRNAIELFGCRGCYGGLAAIEGNRWNAAFNVPAARIRAHRGDIDSLFNEVLQENRALYSRLKGATRNGPWLASPLPRFAVKRNWPLAVIPIGNAAAAIEPIGGEGMGLALRSAEMAVAAIVGCAGQWTAVRQRTLLQEYNRLWPLRRLSCRVAAMIVSSTKASYMAGFLPTKMLGSLVMRGMGK